MITKRYSIVFGIQTIPWPFYMISWPFLLKLEPIRSCSSRKFCFQYGTPTLPTHVPYLFRAQRSDIGHLRLSFHDVATYFPLGRSILHKREWSQFLEGIGT